MKPAKGLIVATEIGSRSVRLTALSSSLNSLFAYMLTARRNSLFNIQFLGRLPWGKILSRPDSSLSDSEFSQNAFSC